MRLSAEACRSAGLAASAAAVLAGLLVLVVPVGIALIGSSVAALLALQPERRTA